jgi:hypothetical protein
MTGLTNFQGQANYEAAQKLNKTQFEQQLQYQKDFAQQGVTWRVADAKKAGIHPLAALGANTISYAPMYMGADGYNPQSSFQSTMGANLATKFLSGMNKEVAKLELAMAKEKLRGVQIENDLLLKQLDGIQTNVDTQVGKDGHGYSLLPDNYQSNGVASDGVRLTQLQRTISPDPDHEHQEVGNLASVGHAKNSDGSLSTIPSNDMKQRIEDMMLLELPWAFDNIARPMVESDVYKFAPSKEKLPKGYTDWKPKKTVTGVRWYPIKGWGINARRLDQKFSILDFLGEKWRELLEKSKEYGGLDGRHKIK